MAGTEFPSVEVKEITWSFGVPGETRLFGDLWCVGNQDAWWAVQVYAGKPEDLAFIASTTEKLAAHGVNGLSRLLPTLDGDLCLVKDGQCIVLTDFWPETTCDPQNVNEARSVGRLLAQVHNLKLSQPVSSDGPGKALLNARQSALSSLKKRSPKPGSVLASVVEQAHAAAELAGELAASEDLTVCLGRAVFPSFVYRRGLPGVHYHPVIQMHVGIPEADLGDLILSTDYDTTATRHILAAYEAVRDISWQRLLAYCMFPGEILADSENLNSSRRLASVWEKRCELIQWLGEQDPRHQSLKHTPKEDTTMLETPEKPVNETTPVVPSEPETAEPQPHLTPVQTPEVTVAPRSQKPPLVWRSFPAPITPARPMSPPLLDQDVQPIDPEAQAESEPDVNNEHPD
jgi:hypothetical protein